MKRLLDGQFDECDLTMRDLELIERALIKTLLGDLSRPDRVSVGCGDCGGGFEPTAAGDRRQDRLMFSLDISAVTGKAHVAYLRRNLLRAREMLKTPLREMSVALVGNRKNGGIARAVHEYSWADGCADV